MSASSAQTRTFTAPKPAPVRTSPLVLTSIQGKALADALAGVFASLLSLWFFYPFEIWKLLVQTNRGGSARTTPRPLEQDDIIRDLCATAVSSLLPHSPSRSPSSQSLVRLLNRWLAQSRFLFAGLGSKSLHAATSSFCYFYFYSSILSAYQLRRQRWHLSSHDADRRPKPIEPSARLLLSAVAAMINTFVTLPMDVISTRHQLHGCNGMDASDDPALVLSRNTSFDGSGTEAYIFYDASSDEGDNTDDQPFFSMETSEDDADNADDGEVNSNKDDERAVVLHMHTDSNTVNQSLSDRTSGTHPVSWTNVANSFVFCRSYPWRSLWKGLVPSLLLCSNPAIHFTVYDVAKAQYILRRSNQRQRIGLLESFTLGLFAKFVATILTYPLIQAKVQLMTLSELSPSGPNRSLWSCLRQRYADDGIAGLYRGCNLQLLHTMLKSALLMMLRERIERTTRRWLLQRQRDES